MRKTIGSKNWDFQRTYSTSQSWIFKGLVGRTIYSTSVDFQRTFQKDRWPQKLGFLKFQTCTFKELVRGPVIGTTNWDLQNTLEKNYWLHKLGSAKYVLEGLAWFGFTNFGFHRTFSNHTIFHKRQFLRTFSGDHRLHKQRFSNGIFQRPLFEQRWIFKCPRDHWRNKHGVY